MVNEIYQKDYYQANKEQLLSNSSSYYWTNRDEILLKGRIKYKEKTSLKEYQEKYQKTYYEKNKSKIKLKLKARLLKEKEIELLRKGLPNLQSLKKEYKKTVVTFN